MQATPQTKPVRHGHRLVLPAEESSVHDWPSDIDALLRADELLEAREALVQSRQSSVQGLEIFELVRRFSEQLEARLAASAQSKNGRDNKAYKALCKAVNTP
jgi:hypothetical protein